jgi:hypothetical protein
MSASSQSRLRSRRISAAFLFDFGVGPPTSRRM